MIKKYQNTAGAMTRIADLLIVLLGWWLAHPIRFEYLQFVSFSPAPEISHYHDLMPLILVLWAASFQFFGVYQYERIIRRSTEIYTLIRAHLATLVLFTALTFFITQFRFSRGVILVFGALVLLGCWLFRVIYRKILRELNRKGIKNTRLLAIGNTKGLQELLGKLSRYPELGIEVASVLNPEESESILSRVSQHQVKMVLASFSKDQMFRMDPLIARLKEEMIDLQIIPDYSDYLALGAEVDSFEGLPLIQLNQSPLFGYRSWLKRFFDFSLSLVGIILISPLLLFIAILVKTTSKGPILYGQERMGIDGKIFRMLKFRSMKLNAEESTGAVWAVENDERRTPIGAFLRSTSIDELPQLWNVIKGDMSLVGPRPERPVFVNQFRSQIPNYMLRHKVKSGITGWAQINGWRGDTSLEKRIECDLYYIRNWSAWLDIKILFLTIFKGFINKNAY
jgi:exopolysaccharide biosynthesis polyprenyl glycosylphosphotransferase